MDHKHQSRVRWSVLVVALILFFLVRQFFEGARGIDLSNYRIDWPQLALSGLFFLTAMPLFALAWNAILRLLQARPSLPNLLAVRLYVTAQFGRYLPGSIWTYAAQIHLAHQKGLPRHVLAIASWYEVVVSTVAVFLLPALLLGPRLMFKLPVSGAVIITLMAAGFALLHPRVLAYCYRFIPARFRPAEFGPNDFLSYQSVLLLLAVYMGIMALNAVGFVLFCQAFHFQLVYDSIVLAGFFILASGLGTLAVFAPGGLGVREGFLALFLATLLPAPLGIFLSLASRLWITLLEVVAYLGVRIGTVLSKTM